ncbi:MULTISPECIES: ferritin-like fold-containing protein [unclassified Actinomyces]|uniref:ferritin-like fold-containing protein n=1 Tax=unclassified Actinomyces TaxID=2609248 RepID=UPI00137466DC|nr:MULTISPECIES: ferritin-like fold-containing protein [unclassified Actinomyces]MBW3070054.1 tRNA 2-methylthio-N6-isopentenyl adenosine(37) hydroxylase MiaE-like protein [Actinomyces sp. 594]NDR53819.1 tRNA 2-methylthio-N6-isopentenyl adenosine(37) hydroxylase MiaE-like protein [Actinomyces sp. 565]QHO90572.1 tRNA 2-methylthio-N6-isopentenyl adenosine(37) hydroxylase MiaE-like protein [Actinomyces sp. 432]
MSSAAPAGLDEAASPARHTRAVVGLAAFTRTIACTRYAKDADKAPDMASRVELLRMSAEAVASFDRMWEAVSGAGIDLLAAAAPFTGVLGDFDERLRPLDWYERLTKTYLTFGLMRDFVVALVRTLDAPLRDVLMEEIGADRLADFAPAQLVPVIGADTQLAARLGLWGRRVVGEEIGTMKRLLASAPDLAVSGADAEVLHEALSQGATSRMRGLGLRV